MLTVGDLHIQPRRDHTVQPGLPVVLGSFHAHSSEMPEDPEPLAHLEENRDHSGLMSNLSAGVGLATTTNFLNQKILEIFLKS